MRSLCALAVLLFVAGCAAVQRPESSAAGYKLYEAAAGAQRAPLIAVIDSKSHATDRTLPIGAPSSDWKHLYSVIATSLVDTDPLTGTTQNAIQLHGSYQLPPATYTGLPGGLSRNGMWLVVESFDRSNSGTPAATHLLVVETSPLHIKYRVELAGDFQFDAVSDDGQRLYLIEYLNGTEYYVRMYNLLAGQLDANIVVDKADGNQAMTGRRLSGVAGAGGHWLFSMYVRRQDNPFIHALGLDGPYAVCIDLPGAGYATDPRQFDWSIVLSPDGSTLYAANTATGIVAEIDTQSFQVTRTSRFPFPSSETKELGANAAVVSPDGKTLVVGGSGGVVWIDAATLNVRSRALGDWRIWSLGMSPDGQSLYAVSETGSIAEVAMASAHVTARFDPGKGSPVALMRVASA